MLRAVFLRRPCLLPVLQLFVGVSALHTVVCCKSVLLHLFRWSPHRSSSGRDLVACIFSQTASRDNRVYRAETYMLHVCVFQAYSSLPYVKQRRLRRIHLQSNTPCLAAPERYKPLFLSEGDRMCGTCRNMADRIGAYHNSGHWIGRSISSMGCIMVRMDRWANCSDILSCRYLVLQLHAR